MNSRRGPKKYYQEDLLDIDSPRNLCRYDYGDSPDILTHDELVSLRGVMEERNEDVGQRILALSERVAEVETYINDLLTQQKNLKNEIITLQDENLHLQLALNRERRKVRRAWTQLEHVSLPSRQKQQPFLSFVLPWNLNSTNENDLFDFADLEGYGDSSLRTRAGSLLTWTPRTGQAQGAHKKQSCRTPSYGHHHLHHYHHQHRRHPDSAIDLSSSSSSRSRSRNSGGGASGSDAEMLSYEPVALD